MISLRMTEGQFQQIHGWLFQNRDEQHAFGFVSALESQDGLRLNLHDLWLAGPQHILHQAPCEIELCPLYVLEALERCRKDSLHLVDIHSHPFCDEGVRFSSTDLAGAERRQEWHAERAPWMISTGLVLGKGSFMGMARQPGRPWQPIERLERVGLKAPRRKEPAAKTDSDWQDRQIRAFGQETQDVLASLKVGIVGLGGTGSIASLLLAMLGVRKFVLVDPDRVEVTNLNRLFTADRSSVGLGKASLAKEAILRINPRAEVQALAEPVSRPAAKTALASSDLLVGCLDNDGARLEVADLASRCLIPWLDMGTGIVVEEGQAIQAGGQFSFWIPGLNCPGCMGSLDWTSVDRAALPEGLRQARDQVYGTPDPAPAVASLNTMIASAAINEAVLWSSGQLQQARLASYQALTQTMDSYTLPKPEACPLCQRRGIGLEADAWHKAIPTGEHE